LVADSVIDAYCNIDFMVQACSVKNEKQNQQSFGPAIFGFKITNEACTAIWTLKKANRKFYDTQIIHTKIQKTEYP
jgi:hypothetical protein